MFLVCYFFLKELKEFHSLFLSFFFFFSFCDQGAREEETENFAIVLQERYPGKSTTMTSGDFQSVVAFTYFVPVSGFQSPPSLSTH